MEVSLQGVICSESANYSVSIGFGFPFEESDFVSVEIDELAPPDGQWLGRVTSTNETGASGIYRLSPDIQAYMDRFYWEMSPGTIEFISKIQFMISQRNKDAWGWFRCILCDGVGLNLAINFAVALTVTINMYQEQGIVWIPDVYPSLQNRAAIRALLLLADCIMNDWWYPYQWALNQKQFSCNV
ncbi:hypothetical protein AeRB84_011317 [Aphanomyces euteiches]|nr:hypothetical protein AeRB84_011317 [Aphanomyces euteiches]